MQCARVHRPPTLIPYPLQREIATRLLNGRIDDYAVRLWTGFTYWDTETTVAGSVDLPGGRELSFSVDQGPVTEHSIILGGHLELSPRTAFALALEHQFLNDVQTFVGTAVLRF